MMIPTLLVSALLLSSAVDRDVAECKGKFPDSFVANVACLKQASQKRADEAKAKRGAETLDPVDAREAEMQAERERQAAVAAATDSQDAAADAALRKKCGADYGRVRVGMKFSRVMQCAGGEDEFEVFAQDERGTVYEAPGGFVRVEHGRVTRWIARP